MRGTLILSMLAVCGGQVLLPQAMLPFAPPQVPSLSPPQLVPPMMPQLTASLPGLPASPWVPQMPPTLPPQLQTVAQNHPIQVHRLYSSVPQQQIRHHVHSFYPYHHTRYYYSESDPSQSRLIHHQSLPHTSELPHEATAPPSHPLAMHRPIYHGLKNDRNHELATHYYGDHPRVVHTTRTTNLNIQPLQHHPDHPVTISPQPVHYPYHHPTGHHSAVHVNPTNVAYHVDSNNHGVGVPGLYSFWFMCDTHNCQG